MFAISAWKRGGRFSNNIIIKSLIEQNRGVQPSQEMKRELLRL